jgi:hypothetical protein
MAEVAKTTAYEGAHSGDFDNKFVKEEDQVMLDRYWIEASTQATETMKEFITTLTAPSAAAPSTNYEAVLDLPSNFDSEIEATITNAVYQYFCNYVIGKWLEMAGGEKAAVYLGAASSDLAECRSKIYSRKAPTRP